MSPPAIIRREPVINRQRAITATRLIVHGDAASAAATLDALGDAWPKARTVLLSLDGGTPNPDLLGWAMPDNAMLEIPAASFDDDGTQALLEELARRGTPLCLDGYMPQMTLPAELQFRFLLADARTQSRLPAAPAPAIAKHLDNNDAFDVAMKNGFSGAAGWFFLNGAKPVGKLNSNHAKLVQLLNLVQRDADVSDIETALKHDVTLSFKLLRYINSAGFGLSCEIQSFHHAVAILGYAKLYKWLSLLLVTASKDPAAPVLMQTAVARGRLMEIVGDRFFGRDQTDNLFIAGAFSLLDAILGCGMEQALEQMHLSDAISDALLRHEGILVPFLDLAVACENGSGEELLAKAEALQLTAERLNRAQLEALSFADSLGFG